MSGRFAALFLLGLLSAAAAPAVPRTVQPPSRQFDVVTQHELASARRALVEAVRNGAYRPPPPPSVWERWRNRALNFLGERLFRSAMPGRAARWTARLLGGLALTIGAAAPLLWRLRRSSRAQTLGPSAPGPPISKAQPWERWRAEAEVLARAGCWREAIHRLFWGAVTRGEAAGLWGQDRTRTPREYLRLLPLESSRRAPLQEPFRALLLSFERAWYAGEPVGEREFLQARTAADHLDELHRPGQLL